MYLTHISKLLSEKVKTQILDRTQMIHALKEISQRVPEWLSIVTMQSSSQIIVKINPRVQISEVGEILKN